MMRYFACLLALSLMSIAFCDTATAAYREVECRMVNKDEPCQWVYKDDPFPPAIKPFAKSALSKKRPAKRAIKPVATVRPVPIVQTTVETVKSFPETKSKPPVQFLTQTVINPPKKPDMRTLPPYMNVGALMEDIRQIKPLSEFALVQPVTEQEKVPVEPKRALSGYVVEKRIAPESSSPQYVPVIKSASLPKRHHPGHKRGKITQKDSWVERLTLAESIQLCDFLVQMIRTQVPEQGAVLALADPPLKQMNQSFPTTLIHALRTIGYTVAGQETILSDVHHVRYRIAAFNKKNLYIRLKVDEAEVMKMYQRTASGNLMDVSPMTTLAVEQEATP